MSLKLLLKFSYKPNKLGLCGRREDGIYSLLEKKKWSGGDNARAEGFARDLKVLYAYLRSIGEACGRTPFDKEVVDAFLFGWDRWGELDVASRLKKNLKRVAIPEKLAEIDSLPEGVPFTHSFHTLYFGAVAADIPRVLGFADRCKVSLGKSVGEGVAEYNRLGPGLEIAEGRTEIESPFIDVRAGDEVFLHHGVVFKKAGVERGIYKKDLENVIKITRKGW